MVKPNVLNDQITVVVTSYNSSCTINDCIGSILKFSPGSPIIVVDNNSSDQTLEILRKYENELTLVESKENLGFAKANNLGFSKVKTGFVVFLNPDAFLTAKDDLAKMAMCLVENAEYALIGPKLIHSDGSVQRSVRNLPSIVRAFKGYFLNQIEEYDFKSITGNDLIEVESVVGACMVLKSSIFEQFGRFDEKYFLYFEDLDLCRKVNNKGLKIGYFPQVIVKHTEGESGKNKKVNNLLVDSAKKYHGLLDYYLIYSIIRSGQILRRLK